MNKCVCASMAVLVFCSVSPAFDYMGSSTAQVKGAKLGIDNPPGQLAFAVDYMYSEQDIEIKDVDVTLDNVKLNKVYFRPSYGLLEGIEIYGLLGGAKAEWEDESDDAFSGGFGTRLTLWENDAWAWGALAQFTGSKFDFSNREGNISGNADVTLYEIEFTTGPVWKITDAIKIYGGPLVHLVYGDIDGSVTVDDTEFSGSADLDQNDPVGGVIGTQVEFTKNLRGSAEFQATGAGYGIGGQLMWAF
jgi:hypothetical protein